MTEHPPDDDAPPDDVDRPEAAEVAGAPVTDGDGLGQEAAPPD
jgi:hypothetical protein